MYSDNLSSLYGGTEYVFNHNVQNSEIINNDLFVGDDISAHTLNISGLGTFESLIINTAPTTSNNAVRKDYVDNAISALNTVYATYTVLSNYETSSHASYTYATQSSLTSYLTNTNAASTYATISSLSDYVAKISLSSLPYSIVPATTLTYDIGSATNVYSNVYANNLIGETYKIGKNLSLTNLYIAHSSHFSGTNYAFGQSDTGNTIINCNSANNITLMYNGSNSLMKLNYNATANQITVYGNLYPSSSNVLSLGLAGTYFLNTFTSAVVGASYKLGALTSEMVLAHSSTFSSSSYAINQNSSGYTKVNCATGQAIDMCVNNSNVFRISPTGLQTTLNFYNNINPGTSNTYSLGTASLLYTTVYATNAVINTSDQNKKQNILTIDDSVALNFINQLNPVKFQWKNTTSVDMEGNTITNIDPKYYPGFLAQEIYNMPTVDTDFIEQNVVSREEDSSGVYWGVRYTSIIPPLVKYCQILPNNLVPSQDDVYDIGRSDKRYQDLFLSGQIFNTSDINQKENIKDADLDKSVGLINMLRSKEYNFIGKSVRRVGLIAQQVSEVLYNLDIDHNIVKKSVNKDGTEIYALDYMALIPHLVTYSQHLFEKNKKLEDRLNKLEHIFSETNSLLNESKKNRDRTNALRSPRKIISSANANP